MKTLTTLFLAALLIIGFSVNSYAQASATATVSATIVTPIAIAKAIGGDMNFGNIAVTSTGGTVLDASATPTRTPSGGVTLPTVTGTVASAKFNVSGMPNYAYFVTLPTSSISIASGGNTMSVGSWTSLPSGTGGVLSGTGAQDLYVGATLTVGNNQAAGTYTLTNGLSVTVNYN